VVNQSLKRNQASYTKLALKAKTDRRCLDELIADPIFRKRAQKMCRFIFRQFNDRESYRTADDLEQELYTRVLLRIKTYNGTAKFETWLYRIAVNIEYDEIKARKSRRHIGLDECSSVEQGGVLEQRVVLKAALEQLSQEERKLIQAKAEGCKIEEIAEQLGLRKSQTHRKLAKALKHFYRIVYGEDAE
jgi:RNA polymerase sigma-70 factor (ECF subfamily)